MKPKISVVICAHNAARTIEKTLISLKNQVFKDFEIVVANDGSTDDTVKIAERYARVINMKKAGLSAARNIGIRNSKADIVAIIDADIEASKNWLQTIYDGLKNEVAVTGHTNIPKSTYLGDCISALGYPGGAHLGFQNMWPVDKQGYTIHMSGGNCGFRKKVIQEIGAFNKELTITGDDAFLSTKILKAGYRIKFLPDMVIWHEPRKSLKSFIRWHYTRGRGNYLFKKQVKGVNRYIKLRLWSSWNIIKKYWFTPKIFLILPLLAISFVAQYVGYISAVMHKGAN